MKKKKAKRTAVQRAKDSQAARRKKGLCICCTKKSVDGWRCEEHRQHNLVAIRIRYRIKHGIPLDAPPYTKGTK